MYIYIASFIFKTRSRDGGYMYSIYLSPLSGACHYLLWLEHFFHLHTLLISTQEGVWGNESSGRGLITARVQPGFVNCKRQGRLQGCLFVFDDPDRQCRNGRKGQPVQTQTIHQRMKNRSTVLLLCFASISKLLEIKGFAISKTYTSTCITSRFMHQIYC